MLPRRTPGHNTILRLAESANLLQECGIASGEIDCDKRKDLEQVVKKRCVVTSAAASPAGLKNPVHWPDKTCSCWVFILQTLSP